MANSKKQLWIAPTTGNVYDSLNLSADAPSLNFTQGDSVDIELHLCKAVDDTLVEIEFPVDASVKLAIGRRDAAPLTGNYVITVGANQTTLAAGAGADAIETALNLNPTILAEGGLDVTPLSAVMVQIKYRTTGSKTSMTVETSDLFPTSYGKLITIRAGDSTHRATFFLKVAQSPVVYQTQWDSIESVEPVAATIKTIGLGYKRIEFNPAPSIGSWTISTTPNVWRAWRLQANWGLAGQFTTVDAWNSVTSLVVPAVAQDSDFEYVASAADVTANKMYATSDYFQPKIKALGDGVYDVIWGFYPDWLPPDTAYYAQVANFKVPPVNFAYQLSIDASGLKPRKGFTATLNLNSAEVEYLLSGDASVDASLEIEVTTSGTKQTILMTECVIKNDMIDGYAYSPIVLDVATIPDAPSNGVFYGRKNAGWTPLTEIDGGSF